MESISVTPLSSTAEGRSWEKSNQEGLLKGLPWYKYGPTGMVALESIIKTQQLSKDFVVRDDDVFVIGIPKSGTTWLQEIVWCIMNDMDLEAAKNARLMDRSPSFDVRTGAPGNPLPTGPPLDTFPSPRVIKTHLQFPYLPDTLQGDTMAKIVYIARDPRDACLSLCHYMKQYYGSNGTIDDFVRHYVDDVVPYGPYWSHVQSFWEQRHRGNLLFLTYEEMKKDLPTAIKHLAEFLGKPLTGEEVTKLCEYVSFGNMKNRCQEGNYHPKRKEGGNKENNFCRKGKAGSWKEELNPDQIQLFEKWMMKNAIPGLTTKVSRGLERRHG